MKKLCLLLAAVMLLGAFVCACDSGSGDSVTTPADTTTPAPAETTPAETTPAETTPAETTPAETTPAETTPVQPGTAQIPESIKILAIGNSFSVDAMEYVYHIAKKAGVKEIVLGNLYIGGCDLATHLSNARSNATAYTYYKNTKGAWTTTKSFTFEKGLTDEKWDVITLQQSSKTSGVTTSYGKMLTNLIDIVEQKKTNPDARLIWHMTWAYQQDSTHSSFPTYGRDQQKMYDMIVNAVKECILTEPRITGVIPNGTAIQNARTSFIGDTITRDGYHLNKTLGRYIAGLCYFSAITGVDISDLTFTPAADITPEVMAMAKDAVKDALAKPYEVTKSTHTTGKWTGGNAAANDESKQVVEAADCFEADKTLASAVGVDLTKYALLEYEYIENAYYYCTKGVGLTYPKSSASTYKQNVCFKRMYTKEEIPEGAVIICDAGWQYRPEKWQTNTASKSGDRPGMVTANIVKIDAAWWGDCNYMALNLAANPKADISGYYAAAASHVRIYVPKAN